VTHDHHIGDLVVDDAAHPYGLILEAEMTSEMTAVIGIVVDKVPGYGPEFNVNVLHVLWSDGTTRTRWDYQVLPLKE
jgi:hypothetical protein